MTVRELKEILEAYDVDVIVNTSSSAGTGVVQRFDMVTDDDLDELIDSIDVWTFKFFGR